MDTINQTPSQAPLTTVAQPAINSGWSWGAFMFDPAFIIAIRNYTFLFCYLLYLIPLVNIVAMIGIKIYLGINGRRMAIASKSFASPDEALGYMKGTDHAGRVLFFATIIIMVLGIVFSVALGTFFRHILPMQFNSTSTYQLPATQ